MYQAIARVIACRTCLRVFTQFIFGIVRIWIISTHYMSENGRGAPGDLHKDLIFDRYQFNETWNTP